MPKSPLTDRFLFLPHHSPQHLPLSSPHPYLTIASYNTLSPAVLYRSLYPYASKNALKWKPRRQILFNEIATCNASIICAQEVSFIDQWRNDEVLKAKYDGFCYTQGGNNHGSLVLTQKGRFECEEKVDILFKEVFENDEDATEEEFTLDSNVAQIVVLKERDGWERQEESDEQQVSAPEHSNNPTTRGLILSNTHLFWNYRKPYIRIRQLLHIFDQCLHLQQKYPSYQIISCGDLNFTPDTADFKLFFGYEWEENDWDRVVKSADDKERRVKWLKEKLFGRRLPKVFSVYQDYRKYFPYTGKDEESVGNTKLWMDDHPVFTTYATYHGTLDYILMVSPSDDQETEHTPWLKNVGFLKLLEDTQLEPGIPSDEIPSDHLMIMGAFDRIR